MASFKSNQQRRPANRVAALNRKIPTPMRKELRRLGLWLFIAGQLILLLLPNKALYQTASAVAMLLVGFVVWIIGAQRVDEGGRRNG